MAFALTEDQEFLAETAVNFAARYAPVEATREQHAALARGDRPAYWTALTDQGLHAIHLPQHVGGQGGGLLELGSVVDEFGKALLPGAFLPTVVCSAAMAYGGAKQEELLQSFAQGATGALVWAREGTGLEATREGTGWVINGTGPNTLGLLSADVIIASARAGSETIWFQLTPSLPGVAVTSIEGVDLTRDLGQVTCTGVVLTQEDLIPGLDPDRVRTIVVALLATEAGGLSRWCVEQATDYAKTREQFDRPIGAFQAVQHKLAQALVDSELTVAAAWDALRGCGQESDQAALASGTAAIVALGGISELVLEMLTALGGIGFTWEHDLHLYWRRAISISAMTQPASLWARDLGATALRASRDFELVPDDEEKQFRRSVANTLDRALELPSSERQQDRIAEMGPGARRTYLTQEKLVTPHWAEPWGLQANIAQQLVIADEFAKRPELTHPGIGIAEWILPTVIVFGTPDQQERFVPLTQRGEMKWCQLFSEPSAGSDLASLKTRAERVDGGWRINGQKVWTSLAHQAHFGALLARTDPEAPKHRGIGYFLLDMTTPGVSIRPLRQVSGHAHFNEVFLDDVFVPDDALLGHPTDGWKMTVSTLANERVAISDSKEADDLRVLRALAATETTDLTKTEALGAATAAFEAVEALSVRETLRRMEGHPPGPGASITKVAAAQALRRAAAAALAVSGTAGMAWSSTRSAVTDELDAPARLIGGGTIEIQLNVIAQSILGLPRG